MGMDKSFGRKHSSGSDLRDKTLILYLIFIVELDA